MKLSIIIPVYNKKNFTISTLKDLLRLNPETHEIVIVDNASSDGTQEEIEKLNLSNLKYYKLNSNTGFGFASNYGFNLSSGSATLFLNNDIRVKDKLESWTDILINNLEKNTLIGPTGGYVDSKNDFKFMYETEDPNKKINYMSGWCLAGYKEDFEKLIMDDWLGPFSQEFFCFFEDTDISFRAKKLGMKFKLTEIPVVHFGHITSNSIGTNKYYNESRKIFIKKWKNKI